MPPIAPLAAGVWPKASVKDVAESLGLANLSDDAASALASDVEYRLHQIIEESVKFMRHAKRTKLKVEDVDHALRVRNIEPLWGFASSDTLAFRRTASAAGNLYFVEDDEIDLSRIVQAQLPPAQRETSYTAHWLAVEGVQPAIPQNPTMTELQNHPGFVSAQAAAALVPGASNSTVKHHLSRELQLYFDRVTTAAFDDFDERARTAGLASLSGDPGLHQVVPYLVQYAAEKVTTTLFGPAAAASPSTTTKALQYTLAFLEAVLSNPNLFLEPYLQQVLPTILTCLLSTSFSPIPPASSADPSLLDEEHAVRIHAGSLLASLLSKYGSSYPTLRTRVLKTLLRALVDKRGSAVGASSTGAGSRWGAVLALKSLGSEATRTLLGANLIPVGEALADDERSGDEARVSRVISEALSVFAHFGSPGVEVPSQDALEEETSPAFAARLTEMDPDEAARAYDFIRSIAAGVSEGVNGKHESEDQEMASASPAED